MDFTLDRTNLRALIAAFKTDKLSKSARKIERHGLDRFIGTFDARDDALRVDSGRVKVTVTAHVTVPGAFTIRDTAFRQLLLTVGEECSLRVVAEPAGLVVNGSLIQFSEGDFRFPPEAAG